MSVSTATRSPCSLPPPVPPRRAQCQAELGAAIKHLKENQAKRIVLEAKVSAADKKLAGLAKETQELDLQETQARTKLAAANARLNTTRAEKAAALEKIASGQAKIASGQAKIDEAMAEKAVAQERTAKVGARLAESEETLKKIQTRRDELGLQLDSKIAHIDRRIQKIQMLPKSEESSQILNELNALKEKALELKESLKKESLSSLKLKLEAFQANFKVLLTKVDAIK